MPLKYALFENALTEDPDDLTARVLHAETRTMEDIIEVMIRRGSTVTTAEALAVLEEYSAALEQVLLEGYRVRTPLFDLFLSIKGVFEGRDDLFDAARHRLHLHVRPGQRLRQVLPKIRLERVRLPPRVPAPHAFEDLGTGTRNAQLTPGGLGRLTGRYLKHDPHDPRQGLFFIAADGTETRVAAVARNTPRELNFLIPATLSPGPYTLAVRAAAVPSGDVRVGSLPDALQVA